MTPLPRVTRRRLLSVGGMGMGIFGVGSGVRAVLLPRPIEHDRVTVAQSDEGNLVVEWKEWYNGAVVEPEAGRSSENEAIITISDVMPGDGGSVSFRLYADEETVDADQVKLSIRMRAPEGAFAENGVTEPESLAGDTGEPGELQEFVDITAWYDMDGMIDSMDACNGVKDVGEPFVDADPTGDGNLVDGDSLGDVTSAGMLGEWTQLDGDPGSAGSLDCLPVGEDGAICLGLDWQLPEDLGGTNDNVIQTDSAEFTIEFRIESCETTS